MRPLYFFVHILWVMSLWSMPSLLSTANIKLSTSLELGLVWGWDCTSTRCCMTYYITVCTCAVLKQILHMLRYCCTKSNKLSPSLIIESLAAAKSAGCLQQSLQAVYSNHCRVFTLVRMWLLTCTCSIYMYSIQLEYFSQHGSCMSYGARTVLRLFVSVGRCRSCLGCL